MARGFHLFFILALLFLWPLQGEARRWVEEKTPEGVALIYPPDEILPSIVESVRTSLPKIKADLEPVFGSFVDSGISLVLDPRPPSHNGLATVVPDKRIAVYVVPPYALGSISESDDWTHETVLHEMVHIAHVGLRRGVMKGLYYMFGTIIAPNSSLPTWLIEGLAVLMETRFSKAGRGRSSFLRMMIEEGCRAKLFGDPSFASLDQMSSRSIPWPLGLRPYMIGYDFLAFVEKRVGRQDFQNYHHMTGGLIPYFWVGFDVADDKTWKDLWKEYVNWRNSTCQVSTPPRSNQFERTKMGMTTWGPELARKGIFFYRRSPKDKGAVYYWKHGKRKPQKLFNGTSKAVSDYKQLAFDEVGGNLWYSATSKDGWADTNSTKIKMYDFKKHHSPIKRKGYDPAVHSAKRLLAFVHRSPKTGHEVYVYDISNSKNPKGRRVCTPRDDTEFFEPEFSRRGNSLYVTAHKRGDKFEIWRCDFKTNRWRRVLADTKRGFISPHVSPQGLFVTQLQAHKPPLNKLLQKRSNKLCSLPQLDGDIRYQPKSNGRYIAGVGYSNKGFDVSRLEMRGRPLSATNCRRPEKPRIIETALPQKHASNLEDYSALSYMLPRFWVPLLYSTNGNLGLGGATAQWDPLMRHQYILSALWEFDPSLPAGYLQYMYQFHPVASASFSFNAYNDIFYNAPENGLAVSYQPTLSASVGSSFFLHPHGEWKGNFGFLTEHRTKRDNFAPSRNNALMGGVNFADTTSRSHWLTFQGISFSLSGAFFHEYWGSETNLYRIRQTTMFHLPSFWDTHALKIHVSSGYTNILSSSPVQNPSTGLTTYSAGGRFSFSNVYPSTFLMRGYRRGFFRSKQLHVANIGYTFPLHRIYRGIGILPFYFKTLSMELTSDFLTGDFSNYKIWNEYFYSIGVEFHLISEVGYVIPSTLTMGFYKGLRLGEFQWSIFVDMPLL